MASIAKTAFQKIGVLICSAKFPSPEVVLHLCEFTVQLCIEYWRHMTGAPSPVMLDRLQSFISLSVGRCISPKTIHKR